QIRLSTSQMAPSAADETELTGILGGSVTFPLRISAAQKFKNGAWSVNTKSLVTVTAGKPPRVLVFDPSYEGRLRFSDESYSLQITDLRMEDTGSYTVEFSTDKEQFAYREFTLHVSSKCWGRGIPEGAWNPPCSGNSQDGRENVTYSWSNAPSSVLSTDSIVHIPQRHQAAREDVTCMARAPDGNSSRRTVSPKDFCAGNALRRETLERAGIGSPLFSASLAEPRRERLMVLAGHLLPTVSKIFQCAAAAGGQGVAKCG
uniref:Immunoglobulin domain-containing protein n=1 Tax=Terrapene triunguis TaxID=2587831 RepID=A0A674JC22_9SAUR